MTNQQTIKELTGEDGVEKLPEDEKCSECGNYKNSYYGDHSPDCVTVE